MPVDCPFLSIVSNRMICGHCAQNINRKPSTGKARYEVSEIICEGCPLRRFPEKWPCADPRSAPTVDQLEINVPFKPDIALGGSASIATTAKVIVLPKTALARKKKPCCGDKKRPQGNYRMPPRRP